ncbi:phospholipase D family protein [Brevibacillus ruminantium]|uniref:phospholipase D n=1 Tax=Brevibacillus ruminantium TaxID=2950604 RepID=A0ABY4WJR9_9BACL|nr:phospholipase D family protein [Brevibacillus ruminantium]USG67393.1 phospholipase D family protein [Brevibacillus ruminantium]
MRNQKNMWQLVTLLLYMIMGMAIMTACTSKTTDSKIEWAFTKADQHPEALLINTINSAQTSLDIAIYSLTHPDIVQAIKDAKARGVAVRVITDKQQSGGQSQTEALKILGSAGIPTKINTHSGLQHLKVTIADKKVATTGSFNYSKAASTVNDEVLVVLYDENVAKAFSEQFERMWKDTKGFEAIEYRIAQPAKVANATASAEQPTGEKNTPAPTDTAACEKPLIKGNVNSKIYHVPGGQAYDKTTANVEMFCTEEEAQAAGYRKSQK